MTRVKVVMLTMALAMAAAGVAYAATFTLSSKHLGGSTETTPVMFPTTVTIANHSGGVAGKPENSDVITIVMSKLVNEPSICSAWANSTSTQSINLTWAITPGTGGAHDVLAESGTAPGPCTASGVHIGTIDLGTTGYAVGTTPLLFQTSATQLTQGATQTTFTITLNGQKTGAGQPTAGTVTNGGAATYTPDSAITDQSSNGVGSNLAKTSATTQF